MRNRILLKDEVRDVDTWAIRRMKDVALRESPKLVHGAMVVTDVLRWQISAALSYHYDGRAIDIRTGLSNQGDGVIGWTDIPGAIVGGRDDSITAYQVAYAWANRIRLRLGSEFDVVFGSVVKHWNHIHIEWDRRKEEAWFSDE